MSEFQTASSESANLFASDESTFDRRRFLWQVGGIATAIGVTSRGATALATDATPTADFGFFVIGDTHFLADRTQPEKMDEKSATICGRLIETLNQLPGTSIPQEAGGGVVLAPQGVIHAGDVIDTGDKRGSTETQMQRTELARFRDEFGLTGKDGRLAYPVYEIAGNHDAPNGEGLFVDQIRQRNKQRTAVVNVSGNGVHYSWDWGGTHFVNLGLIVGADATVSRRRRYASLDSLSFLIADLKEHVGNSRRPIVLTHHVDIARYSVACNPDAPMDSKEWDPCDVRAFHQAIRDFNVAGIFYGHTHARSVFQWDGLSANAKSGIRVFNADNASHFGGDSQAFFYVESRAGKLVVREYQTTDRWKTGHWTPMSWSPSIA